IKLPPYREEVVRVVMSENQAAQYKFLYDTLFETFRSWYISRDTVAMQAANRLLSTWVQRSLGRPDAAFRREMIIWKALPGDDPEAYQAFGLPYLPTLGLDTDYPSPLPDDPDMPTVDLFQDPEYIKWRK